NRRARHCCDRGCELLGPRRAGAFPRSTEIVPAFVVVAWDRSSADAATSVAAEPERPAEIPATVAAERPRGCSTRASRAAIRRRLRPDRNVVISRTIELAWNSPSIG